MDSSTLRQLAVIHRHMADLWDMLASETDAENDIREEELQQTEKRVQAAFEVLREQVGENNLMISVIAEHEAGIQAQFDTVYKRIDRRKTSRDNPNA